MSNWSEGYAADADYVVHYTPELNPLRSRLLLAHAGFAPGPIAHACELGFGLGLGTVVHAAASPVTWWGTDFSPSQALFARELAAGGGIAPALFDESFAEFCARPDLPEFDFIALHGVWSWVSAANRERLVDFVRRKLRVGGVLYISYNAQPGWSQMVPVREIMRLYAERSVAPGSDALSGAEAAHAFVSQLLEQNPQIAAAYPQATQSVAGMAKLGPRYISHEYLNRDWTPMSFAEIARSLDAGKVGFACSAAPTQHFDEFFLAPAQRQYLDGLHDPVMRETVRDFLVNRRFRKDYWIKGGRRQAPDAVAETLRQQRLVLIRPPAAANRNIAEATLPGEVADGLLAPLLDLLSDHRPRAIGELAAELAGKGLALADVVRGAMLLIGNETLACAQDEAAIAGAREKVARLNRHIAARARHSAEITALACPVTGGAIAIPQFQLQMLDARAAGAATPRDWAQALWRPYRDRGVVLNRNGTALLTEEENLAYLTELGESFEKSDLPIFQALGCAS